VEYSPEIGDTAKLGDLWGYSGDNDVSDGFSRIETIYVASKSVRCMSFNFCCLVVVVFFGVMGKWDAGRHARGRVKVKGAQINPSARFAHSLISNYSHLHFGLCNAWGQRVE